MNLKLVLLIFAFGVFQVESLTSSPCKALSQSVVSEIHAGRGDKAWEKWTEILNLNRESACTQKGKQDILLIDIVDGVYQDYDRNSTLFENLLDFLGFPDFDTELQGLAYSRIYDLMQHHNHVYSNFSSDIFRLGQSVKNKIVEWENANQNISSTLKTPDVLINHFKVKRTLPECVHTILFADYVQFFNTYYSNLIYATTKRIDGTRRVLNWKDTSGKSLFRVISDGSYYRIRNTHYNEQMIFSSYAYMRDRQYVFTYPDPPMINGMFRFVAESSVNINIYTQCQPGANCGAAYSGKPVYAASKDYDSLILFWVPGNLVREATWHPIPW